LEKARAYLEKALQLGDQMPREEYALALCDMRLGKFKSAEAVLKKIIGQYPDYNDPYFCLGAAYYEEKNNREARRTLEEGLKLDPKNLFGYALLMKVYSRLQNSEAEKELLNKADKNLSTQKALELRGILEKTRDSL
jgi:tetratricopeptide (TPR) repeat protein